MKSPHLSVPNRAAAEMSGVGVDRTGCSRFDDAIDPKATFDDLKKW
jgi:hypothetical protein